MELKKNPSKDVHRQSGMFFFLGLGISIAIVICAFEWRTLQSNVVSRHEPEPEIFVASIDPRITVIEPEAPKEKQIVKKTAFIPENLVPTNEPITASEDTTTFADTVIPQALPSLIPGDVPDEDIDTPMVFPEVKPEPVGGYDAMYEFLAHEVKYPHRAKRDNIQGKVFVEFIVSRSGQPEEIKVVKGFHALCDAEAVRVIALTKWEAGRQRGKAVRVKMVFPLVFQLQ